MQANSVSIKTMSVMLITCLQRYFRHLCHDILTYLSALN